MNELIEKYSKQCSIKTYNAFGYLIEFGFNEQKFAELMVQQFKNIVKDVYLKSKPEHRSCLLELDAVLDETFGV